MDKRACWHIQKMCVSQNYECVRTTIHGCSYTHCVLNRFTIGSYTPGRNNSSDDDNWVADEEGESSDCDVNGEPINYSHMFHSMNTHDNTYKYVDSDDEDEALGEEENEDDEENEEEEDNEEEEENEVEGEVRIYSQTYNLRLLERIS